MAESETTKTNYLDTAATAGLKKASEGLGDILIDGSMKFVGKQYEQYKVRTGATFKKYLDNAYKRLNQMKTLATGLDIVPIVGLNSIYVNMAVRYMNNRDKTSKDIEVITAEDLLDINNNVLIVGTGGAGKTMMLKYLFLNTRNRGSYIPVFLELRKLSGQKPGSVSILQLIYDCMKAYDVDLPLEYLEYSLQQNKYLFLMDGLDEVDDTIHMETAYEIQRFCAKYPKNACIVTSRETKGYFNILETFAWVRSLPLDIEKALCLVKKLGGDEEKNKAFCEELKKDLFLKHDTFAENPLLLTMMFLVYMRNGSIPDHLVDFYSKCFEVLYSVHDSHHKGNYKRHFKCKDLTEQEFRRIFASFCFSSYLKSKYEFSEDEIIAYLNPCIAKGTDKRVKPEDYLNDLQDAVCLIVKEGEVYRFVHRSFQTFFAAIHTDGLNDEQQKHLMNMLIDKALVDSEMDYYILLHQIQPERFYANVLEPTLEELIGKIYCSNNPDKKFLKLVYKCYNFVDDIDTDYEIREIVISDASNLGINIERLFSYKMYNRRYSNILFLFNFFVYGDDMFIKSRSDVLDEIVRKIAIYVKQLPWISASIDRFSITGIERRIESNELDAYIEMHPEDTYFKFLVDRYYTELIKHFELPKLRSSLEQWLKKQEQKRKKVESANDFDSLVDSLI